MGSDKDAVFREVVWTVNGREFAGSDKLDPKQFQKGERVQARGKVLVSGKETNFETSPVLAINSPPLLGDVRLDPRTPTTGGTVRAIVAASDPDGEPVTVRYKWFVDDKEVPGEGDTLTLKGVRKGSWVHARISTSDGAGEGPWKHSPRYQVVNSLPVVKSGSPPDNLPGRKFSYRILAEDPDGDPLTITLVKAPPGMVLNGSTLEWVVPDEYIGKPVEVVVNISDGDGGQTVQTYTMTFRSS